MLPPADWYRDPSDPSMLRWWDSKGWTGHTKPLPHAGPELVRAAPAYAPGPVASAAPASWTQGEPTSRGKLKLGARRSVEAFRYHNSASLGAILFTAMYVVIALVTHIVFFGIVPIIIAARALRRHERLAPVAMAVAIIPLVLLLLRFH